MATLTNEDLSRFIDIIKTALGGALLCALSAGRQKDTAGSGDVFSSLRIVVTDMSLPQANHIVNNVRHSQRFRSVVFRQKVSGYNQIRQLLEIGDPLSVLTIEQSEIAFDTGGCFDSLRDLIKPEAIQAIDKTRLRDYLAQRAESDLSTSKDHFKEALSRFYHAVLARAQAEIINHAFLAGAQTDIINQQRSDHQVFDAAFLTQLCHWAAIERFLTARGLDEDNINLLKQVFKQESTTAAENVPQIGKELHQHLYVDIVSIFKESK
jgi:hypothetical protein